MNLRRRGICCILIAGLFVRASVTFAQDGPEPHWQKLTHQVLALDKEGNVVYLVTAQREDKVAPGQRPAMVPGSFELIVVKPQ